MRSNSTIGSAALLGCATGLRSMTGVAAFAQHSGSDKLKKGLAMAAAGEWVADKLPFVPARVAPAALAGRLIFGAICGALVARERNEPPALAIVAGVAGAAVATFAAYHLRKRITSGRVPDFAVALAEDAIAAGLAASAVSML